MNVSSVGVSATGKEAPPDRRAQLEQDIRGKTDMGELHVASALLETGWQRDVLITVEGRTITFRVGSTGRNYSTREFEGHMHNGLWRVDINLDGPKNNFMQVNFGLKYAF